MAKSRNIYFEGSPQWVTWYAGLSDAQKKAAHDLLRKAQCHLASIINNNPKLRAKLISAAHPELASDVMVADVMASLRNVRIPGQYNGCKVKNASMPLDEVYEVAKLELANNKTRR